MKKGKVICKFILVILLLLSMLPIFVTNTAVAVDLEGQDNTTQSDKVKFKAYFTSSTGTETHSMVADINGQRPEINYQINVEEGRLENPVIKVTDENGTLDNNFMMPIKLSGTSQVIDRIDAENKTIYFRQITDGYITGSFPLSIDATADFDLKKMNQNSKITLTGTYYGDDGSVVSINKSIYVNLGWEANFNIHVAQRISKYIPYNRNGERGITIQIAVRTRLDTATKPYPLPVKKTTVTMQIPTFNGINPTQYAVAAVSTAATNGRDGTVGNEVIFSNANCSADLENHTITIQVENTPEDNVVASSLGTDEYLITFDYPASAYDSIMETGNAFLCKTTSTMEVYSNTSTKTFTNTAEDNYTLKEIVGADSEGALEKAIFYRNSIKQESGVEQGYNFNVSLEIQELGTINSLRIEEHDQEFVDAEGNRYSTNVDGVNYIYTTMFAMSKQNFEMIFGTEGYVQVYDKKGTLLGTINKNSPLDENGFYYINLPEKTGPVVSITSKPIVISGTYTYIAHRDISPDMPYTKAEISTFQNLAEGFTNTSRKDGESDYTGGGSAEAMLPLVEPLSQSTISISKQSLEVGKVNENVILTITVKNGAPAKFEWYARPIFDIELPEYITDVEINASRMLYTNDLSIKNVEVIKRNGKNYLRVTVDGESTNLYTKDTTIEINTNLTVDPMTPTVAKDITMYYYNESSVHYYNEVPWALEGIPEDGVNGIDTIQVGFIADPELISVSEISNYESTGKVVNSLEETNNTGKIENNNQDTTANMTLKILNNTFAECTNPVILGRIPTQGNKTPVSGEDLGSTFTTLLAGNITAVAGIEPSQMTIYYSENADATKDIAEPSNGWTTTPSDLKTIKSYLIVTNDFTLPAGEMLQFTYPFTVPANQSYLSTSYGTFGVYYNQNNTAESGKVGLVIPEGEKYTFLLTKTDENSGTIIQNVTFNLNGRGLSVTKYKTNALGQIRIAGLYPNEIYTLSEEPLEGYQVEEGNQIQFKLISESGTWKLQVLKGSFNGEAQITPESSGQEIVASVSLTNTKIKYNITTEAGEGGTISGSEENPYEIVGYGENSTKDIVITPNPNYEIKTIYVNDEPTEIPTLGPDGTVTLDKFTNVTENIHVRVEFQKIVAGGVTVKYIDKATGEEILQQKTQSGYVGDNYSFTREEIASYEAEEPEPTNSTGYLTKDPIEVIFYYKKVEPDITGHSITKTGPEKITSDTDAISYTIQYQVNVNQYIGEATVTIVDTLPYALDEDKVNQLDGGNYDAGQKTITWVETIENFDTYQTEAKTITFTKNVTLYYKDMNYGAENVQNQVSGKLSLKTPTKEDTVKGQVTTPIEITTSVEAVKTWGDNENADGNRPEAIYLQVKNDQGLVQEQKVTGDDWRYTFTGLPKYNADGSVITYTVDEREENPGDLKLYDKQISGNTITNTYKLSNTNIKEPAIDKTGTSTITSKDEQLEYTITYNATVENYIGTGTVTIVDTLPYAIDESKPYDLAGGEYNKQAKTITWVESLGNIDTFQEGAKQVNISKTIQLSYENINVEEGRLVNNVSGKIDLDATKDSDTQTDTFETTENFVTSVEAVKTWVDNEDADGNRPESIYLQVKNGDEMVEEVLVTGPDWKHTFTNLPKYSSDGTPITYTVDEREETAGDLKLYDKQISGNTITNTYKLTNTTIQTPSIDKTGTTEITSKEDQVQYTLTYTATVENYIGTGRVTIVDTLPYEIDETKEYDLAGGIYNKEAKTITWVEELGEVDTFNQGAKQINISKTIRLSYENINVQETSFVNNVSGKIDLDATKDTDTKTDTFETTQNFVTSVEAVKTWVDNENADGNRPESIYLQVKNGVEMVEEALVTGPDWKYTFTNLPKYEEDGNIITYTVDEREAETGDLKLYTKQIEGNTITNTYKLTNQSIQNPTIDKTGTAEITSKDQALTYTITYTATVENYIGTGRVTIVDTLPYELDELKPNDLQGGEYNKEAKTITWVEELGDIDTFSNEAEEINITKTITVYYQNINVEEGTLVNNVSGKIDLDTTKETDTKEDTFTTTENFVTSVEAVKTWEDNENADGNRPTAIYLQVKNGEQMVQEQKVTGPDWKYTFNNLPKYSSDGNSITYTVDEREETPGDLTLYNKQISGNTITNTYKLSNINIKEPTIDKTGTSTITSKDEQLEYTITYNATVENYIGTGRVTIVDTLPYAIDESKPYELDGGNYNKEAKTITWVENLGDIDTFQGTAKEISISKTIQLSYENINVEEGSLVNNVSGTIYLDTTKDTDTKEDTFETTENFVTSVEAVKTWEDNENADGNRPTAIYLQVKNGEQMVQEQKVTGPDWKYTFNNLPKYSSDGNSITYTVDEREETPGDLTLYNKQISGNTITNTYKLSNINIKEPTIDKTGTSTITSKDEQLEYTITYNATVENYIGTGRVTIVDTLPYAIDESKPYELDGGNYDKEAKTITWVEDLGDIDTFQGEVKEINISKTIQLSYENINVTEGSFSNKVSGKIELDTTKDTNTTEDTFETTENFVTSVEAVKTWVDNDNADGNRPKAIYLQVKNGNEVVQESLVTEKEGWKHTFTNLPKYGEDGNSITYTVDEREQTSGDLSLYDKQIKGNTITNTYKLTDTSIQDPSIQKMGTLEITSKDQALDYIISYTATVNNYIGTGRVTIVDTLPYELDESKPNNLDGGIYNKEAKTITWVEELGDIDTFQGEAKEINITKNIKVYYQNISVQEDKLINKVSGKIDLDTTKETNTQEDTLETKQNFVTEVEVVKTWVDEENADGNRPDVIYLQVKNGDQVVQEQKVTGPDWKYTFTGLPKYSSEGSTITYTVDEREETPGDLALYNKQISGNTITNTYKLSSTNIKEPSIEKTGTTEITSKDEQVEYTITYHATVENYVGTGTVTIVDTLPYAIDETKPYDLAGGTYNKEAKTITWVENLGDIDTFQGEAKEINIRKTIQLSYENINVEEGSLNNKVSGTIYLDTTKDTDTKEDTFETTENFVTEVEVVKTWEDEENADGNRPDAIYLQVKNGDEVVQESLVTEKEGWKHTFTGLPKYQADGSIITYTVDEREETAGDLELYDKQISGNTITNTYKLTDSSIKNPSIEKTGTTEITNQQQAITYTIHYTANIENYIGTGRVTIVDTLPYELDEAKPNDLAGGNYDKQTKTITWVEELGEMDTFAGQTKEINISKTITVYYQNISPAEGKIVNQVTGKVELDTTKETNTKQDTWETTKNFLTEVEVVKTWVDNENADGNRPESIYLQVKNGNEVVQESLVTEKEGWKHTFTGLPKYHADGSIINYTVDEREVNAGDLTLYDKQINGNIITNTYKLSETSIKNPTIEKTGTDVIANETESLTYKIAYNVTIENYLGNAQVTIVDTLPYELDETKENKLDGGTYDAKTKTITWTQTIENIDTYQKESMLVSITKNIEVYYKEIKEEDASFVNTAEATITLETTKETQTVTDKTETSKNFTTELQVSKIWEDNNNQDGNRPEAIYLQVKDGNTVVQEQKVDETNDWKYTFTGLPKYHTDGSIINYTIDEKEVKKGDLTFYQKSINGNVITNTYTLNKESIQNPKIEKEGPAEITEVTDAITYTITYQANVTNYQGSGTLTIVDTLPYPLDETKQNNLAGGTYDKETQTITWVEELSNINAIGDNVQTITWNKAIQVYYSITDDTVTSIRNTVKGTIFLENGEQTDTQEDTQTVVTKQDGSVIVHYYLEGTTQKIAEDVVIVGKVGETYQTTEVKDIDSKYELVTVPDNKEGTIGENSQTVIYYYRIKTYEITTEAGEGGSITGSEEKPFEVVKHGEDSQKEIIIIPSTGYKVSNVYINDVPVDFTVREDGTVTLEQIKNVTENKKVVAVFEKIPAGGITVHYVDKETGEELLPTEQIEGGYVGETYVVKRKDIPYYNPVLPEPENSKGRLTEGNIDVTFYYQKQVFDITVDKWIQSVTVDGETKAENTYDSKEEIVKRDVHAKKTNQTTIEVSYCIRVSNTGEIAGTVGKVIESIPEGMYWNPEENPGWIQDEVTGYIVNDSLAEVTLKPGEYKELEFVLHWKQGEANIGEQINQVFIQDVNNEAQYQDSKPNNDTAKAELLIAISPGIFENHITYIVIAILVLSTTVVLIVHYRTKTKQR